ncbi:LysR family transcriptional regulator [Microvirga makkahensis]|uniref:LysR family transcriptional regulator n=1 Tax=Microvirga makkahensis TaxID=1128670 RepID=A0A7X3SM48_9HYPH|nr:LysR family transcriptional regulator [Microvirga makkahensis]MXQ09951.1 LysR family transcriptional regulator [Microvirga makkahensis]
MDLNAVHMFITVVQAGSLSAAATRLGVPLPTLSRKIAELEGQLNVQLLERSARGSKVTEAGERLYDHASGGIEALQEARQSLINEQTRLKGRLRLSLPQSFEPWWDLLGAFQRRYPDIQVSVHSTERRVDLLADGIDVALRVGAVVHETVVARHLLSFRHVLVASPDLIARLGPPAQPRDLDRYPCAAWGSTGDAQVRWNLGGQAKDIRPIFTVNDYLQLRDRTLSGDVITELPPFLAAGAIRSGDLVPVLPERPFPESPVHLIYRQHRHPSTIVRAYLAFCQGYLPMIRKRCEIQVPHDPT